MGLSAVIRKLVARATGAPAGVMRAHWAVTLVALLLAPAAFAQVKADPPTDITYNFRTGIVNFTRGACRDSNEVHWRITTDGSWTISNRPGASTVTDIRPGMDALPGIRNRDYVEVRMRATGDSPPCPANSVYTPIVTYQAVTIDPTPLGESSLDGIELSVTLGDDHAFVSGVSKSSFELIAPGASGLSIASITGGTAGSRAAILTLSFNGELASQFELKVRVAAAAHNGATDFTSFSGPTITPDYDDDDDGLIEITTLAQLNAVRWDLDGDGDPAASNAMDYNAVFATSNGLGCPATGCVGYELGADLDFDTDGDGDVDSNDPGSYANWVPISNYTGRLEGSGHTIARLRVTNPSSSHAGLFAELSGNARIAGVGLIDARVSHNSTSYDAGTLVGTMTGDSTVIGSYAVGGSMAFSSTGNGGNAGGLVGNLNSQQASVRASFSSATASCATRSGCIVGGLVGRGGEGDVVASYATGAVTGSSTHGSAHAGGLIGRGTSAFLSVTNCYSIGAVSASGSSARAGGLISRLSSTPPVTASYWDSSTSGQSSSDGGTSQSTSNLQTPTSATGIYAAWTNMDVNGDGNADEDPWDFGTNSEYPVLKAYGHVPANQRHGVTVSPTALTVPEGGSATYTARLNTLPSATVTVTVTSGETGAVTADTDTGMSGNQSTLSFTTANWAVPQAVALAGVEDEDGVGETVTVTNAASTASMSEYTGLSTTLEAQTQDNDTPGFVFDANPTTQMTDEAGPLALVELPSGTTNSASYSVRLATTPTQAVTVTITSGDTGAVTVGAPTLTFTTSNWNTAQNVTLTAAQDDDAKDESVDIAHAASTATASEYMGVTGNFGASVDDDETPGVTLSPSPLTVQEQGNATYTVVLNTEPVGGTVTVAITGATSDLTLSTASLSFTAANWDTAQSVTVSAADDQNTASEQTTLTHTASGADYDSVSADLVVTAADNDTPSLQVAPTSLTVAEAGSATYTVRLNTQPSATVTVTVSGATTEVTADTDRDTTGDQTTLTFTTANWDTSQTVTVSAAADDDATDEVVNLAHAASGGDYTGLALSARPGVAVTADDDDTPAILIDADPTTPNMDEAGPLALKELAGDPDKTKNYSVRLATEPTQSVTVAITSGDRAVTVSVSTLTFTTANWSTAQSVTATAAEDDDASDERVAIAHSASGGDYENLSVELIATTVDDDEPALTVTAIALATSGVAEGAMATYTLQLATEPDGIAVVSVAASGGPVSVDMDGGQAGLQTSLAFDAMTWNVARTVTVTGMEDDDGEAGMATLRHTASGADYGQAQAVDVGPFAVADNDTAAVTVEPTMMDVHEGSTATYSVTLATAPVGGPATIAVAGSDDDIATVSPATLTFTAANWNTPRQVTVSGVVDSDATEESATITHTVSGADYGSVTAADVTARVLDAERPGLRIEPLRLTVREGESASYRMRLNTQPTGDVTVTETSDSTALSLDSDGTPQTLSLTFTTADWNTEQTVTVEAASDDDADDVVTRIQHNVTGYTGVATAPDVPVLIEDDEAVGVRFDPAGGLTLTEGGGAAATGTYTVVLTAQPTASVTLALSSDDAGLAFDADGATQGDQTSMTFTTANWNTAQTVTVRAEADGDAASETATLLHAGSGGGYGDVAAGYSIRLSDADAAAAPGRVTAASAGPSSLMVSWTASANAQSYLVQWRVPGGAWSTARQLAVTGTTARIDGLETGSRYEVRVLGVNRGAPGEPSASALATPLAGAAPDNRAPEPVGALADLSLAIGETRTVDISAAFVDPDGDALTYAAWSLDESVATAWVLSGGQLRVRGNGVGVATVMVQAMDTDGLTATRQLRATVGVTLSLAAAAEAPEGGTARLMVTLSTARAAATTFNWRVMADMDAATVDADAGEHGDASGDATIAAGETTAEIAIAIADDDVVEPAREWFDVVLEAPADGCCVVRQARARVAVLEGVCDRTPAVVDALRGDGACTVPTPATLAARTLLAVSGADTLRAGDFQGLAALRWLSLAGNDLAALPEDVFAGLGSLRELDLSGNALTTLPPESFAGLPRLRLLDLSGNAFETLPAGLFAGLSLREASVEDNPGAPFPLAAELTRTDADEPWAPGPATLEARLPSGAPFAVQLPLTAEPALATLPAMLDIPAGATAAEPFAASAPPASALVLRVGAATLPAATCGEEWPFRACFRGLAPQPSATLTLFRQPPRALPAPEPEPLAGDALRLPLATLIAAGDGALRWQASSSDESVATVRVVGRDLLVEPEPGAEGMTEIVLVGTDAVGLTATVRFTVQVEFFAATRLNAGWRTAIGNVAPQ